MQNQDSKTNGYAYTKEAGGYTVHMDETVMESIVEKKNSFHELSGDRRGNLSIGNTVGLPGEVIPDGR
jgi:hypothetical protein